MTPDQSMPLTIAKGNYDEARGEVSEASLRLEAARKRRREARRALDVVMARAQQDGMTWAQIGAAMGLSAQGASQMFKRYERGADE